VAVELVRTTLSLVRHEIWTWQPSALLNRSRVVQACSLLPLLGYVVLWGDATQEFVKNVLSSDIALGNSAYLPWTVKLHLLYIGSAMMLVGLIIYHVRCPRLIRKFVDEYDYWQFAVSIKSPQVLVDCLRGAVRRIEMNTVKVMDRVLFQAVKEFLHEIMQIIRAPKGEYDALNDALQSGSGFDRSAFEEARKLLVDNASVAYHDGPIRAPSQDFCWLSSNSSKGADVGQRLQAMWLATSVPFSFLFQAWKRLSASFFSM
jgi:hypothetical protein